MPYKHTVNFHHRSSRARKVKKIAVTAVVLCSLLIIGISADWFINKINGEATVVSESTVTAVQSAQVSVLKTGYFQFQAPNDWVLLNNEQNDSKFVYVKKDRTLITHMLIIYVNRQGDFGNTDHRLTYVLPVVIDDSNKNFLEVGKISEHCKESWPSNLMKNPTEILHAEVKFKCVPDSEEFNVLVGKINGDANLVFNHKDESTGAISTVNLNIIYSDLTATPSEGDLESIISSFSVQ